jgi:ribosomal protein L10
LYDSKGVSQLAKLPTKQELMQTTAVLLKQVPTKLARVIQEARGTKLARAVDAAKEKLS